AGWTDRVARKRPLCRHSGFQPFGSGHLRRFQHRTGHLRRLQDADRWRHGGRGPDSVHVSGRRGQDRLRRALRQAFGHRRPGQPAGGRCLCAQAGIAGPSVSERGVLRHRRARCAGRQVGQPLRSDRRQRGDPQHPGHAEGACRLFGRQRRPWSQRHLGRAHGQVCRSDAGRRCGGRPGGAGRGLCRYRHQQQGSALPPAELLAD
ncbi:hypothetical protein OY671_009527, partial [Metschnikowia pulcherrima]